jgi:hypothetical protein
MVLFGSCDPGPTEKVLIGTWEITFPYGMDATTFMTLKPDHTIVSFGDSISGPNKIYFRGNWSTDGKQITIRHQRDDHEEIWTWDIVKKRSNKLRLHFPGHSDDDIWTRRHILPPQASNQAMERTATRWAFTFLMIKPLSLRATLALGGRRSSPSR